MGLQIFYSLLAGGALSLSWRLHEGTWSVLTTFLSAIFLCKVGTQASHSKKLSYLAGLIAIGVAFSWLNNTIVRFGGFPAPLALGVYTLFTFGSALSFPLASLFHERFKKNFFLLEKFGILYPLCFVAAEKLPFLIFPWKLGHGLLGAPYLIQIADIGGASILTLLTLLFGESVRQLKNNRKPLMVFSFFLLVDLLYGSFSLRHYTSPGNDFLISVVQANISIEDKHNVAMFEDNLNRYIELSDSVSRDSHLIIWPESVMTQWLPSSLSRKEADKRLDKFPTKNLVFGGLTFESEDKYFNSALGITSKGEIFTPYNKQILMPFGEYMPFSSKFPWIKSLNPVAADFTPGDKQEVFIFDDKTKIAPLICYEDIVPEMSSKAVLSGATFLVNLTNDAWFGDTMAPYQHQRIAAFRAIENRRFLIRSTNSGVTSVISPTGKVIQSLPVFSDGILETSVYPINSITWYSQLGTERFPTILFFLGVIGCLIQILFKKQSFKHSR